jgi:uncharacterized protein with HEPN domain
MSGPLPDDRLYLQHILDAITRIQSHVSGVDRAGFDSSPLVQDAVVRQLEIIGEAAKRVSSQLRDQSGWIPWREIAGTRDKLIHDYMGVDWEAVWLTVQDDLGPLKRSVQELLGGTGTASQSG